MKTGPFKFNAADPTCFRVRIEADVDGRLSAKRARTEAGARDTNLNLADEKRHKQRSCTDSVRRVALGYLVIRFRNRVEGWAPPAAPALHNRVHVWVGGDMLPSSSPNDPVFYLNHCNVDSIWEAWLTQQGRTYLPPQTAPASLRGHRINDQMSSLVSAPTKPSEVLDMRSIYVYDSLAV